MKYLYPHWCFLVIENCSTVLFTVPWEKTFQEETWWFKLFFFPPFTVIQLLYQSSLQSLLQPALGNLGVHREPGFHPLFILVQTQQCSVTRWFCTGRHQIPPGEWRWSCAMFCTRETVKLANKSCSSGVFLFYSAVIHTFISPSVWTVSSPAAEEFGFFY